MGKDCNRHCIAGVKLLKKFKRGIFAQANRNKYKADPNLLPLLFPDDKYLKDELDTYPQLQLFVWGIHRELGSRPCVLALRCNRAWDYRKGTKEYKGEVVIPPNFAIALAEQPRKFPKDYISFLQKENQFLNLQRDKRSKARLAGENYDGALALLTAVVTPDRELYEYYQNERGIDKLFFFDATNQEQLETAKRHAVRLYNDDRFSFKDLHRSRTRKAIADRREQRKAQFEKLEDSDKVYFEKHKKHSAKYLEDLNRLNKEASKEEEKDKERERSLYPDLEELWGEFGSGQPMSAPFLNFLQIAWVAGEEVVTLDKATENNSVYF